MIAAITSHRRRPLARRGITVAELVVSASLLITAMATVAPLAVQSKRIWQQARNHHLILDELSAQLERLTHLDADGRQQAIENLEPSEHIRDKIPSAEISANVVDDRNGRRLVVTLNWDRVGNPKPISLVGWLDPMSEADREAPSPSDDTSASDPEETE